jgi:GDPmannose 4,6-dehydratase
MSRRALICGVTGQDGAYLTRFLSQQGYEVHGTSRDAQTARLDRLERLGVLDRVTLHSVQPTDFRSIYAVLASTKPHEVYGLSGQSSVGLSFEQPVETLDSVAVGTLHLLEAVRLLGLDARVYTACSSEVFGDTQGRSAREDTPFAPRSPYGVAKAAAYWHTANYRDGYGLFACSGLLFNHESPLRPERFVTRKVVASACRIADGEPGPLVLGDLTIRRDWGWAPEYVEAMHAMLQVSTPSDFVVATGEQHSLGDFVAEAFRCVGLSSKDHVRTDPTVRRPLEIAGNVGDASRAAELLGWRARTRMAEVVRRMVDAERGGAA